MYRRYDEVVACDGCDTIVCAPAPPTLLDGGLLGPTLVTEAVCAEVLDGAIEFTNNRSERELRPVCLGRHSWLFVGDQIHAARGKGATAVGAKALPDHAAESRAA